MSIALLVANWRVIAAAILGALLCWPVASCHGERRAARENAAKVEIASRKVTEAAAKAEIAAMTVDAIRRAETKADVDELKEIVNERGTSNAVGPATAAIMQRLRERDRR